MKRFMLICSLFLLGMACSNERILTPSKKNLSGESLLIKERISLQDVAFQESTGFWLHKKGDPYTLNNFRRVYNEVLNGKYQELTRSEIDAVAEAGELSATHYSVKLFPKTEAQQWQLERMDDINISYYPFEYALLSDEQVEELNVTRSSVTTLPDETRYTVTCDNLRTVEGPVSPETFTLPVIYAVWPVNKPFPTNFDYEIVDNLYIPDYSAENNANSQVNKILETRAFDPILTPLEPTERTYTGRLMDYDSTLMRAVPLTGVRVQMRSGSSAWVTYTDGNGYFSITAAVHLISTTIEAWLQNTNWRVILGTSTTNPYIFSLGDPLNHWNGQEDGSIPVWTNSAIADLPLYLAARAIDHYFRGYFNDTHEIPGWTYNDMGLKIYVPSLPDEVNNYAGLFYPAAGGAPAYIKIFTTDDSDASTISAVYHELGHFYHYCERGASVFSDLVKFIKESFASYVGDYLARNYYAQHNKTFPEYSYDIYIGWQDWTIETDGIYRDYTPLFVDLFDNYNQNDFNNQRPSDVISNFSHDAMLRIARECNNWSSCKQILQSYVGVYYSQSELNTNLSDYNYTFGN